jgi:hypothetical protein
MVELIDQYDAVGLFHLSEEVHDEDEIDEYRKLFDGVIELDADGNESVDI